MVRDPAYGLTPEALEYARQRFAAYSLLLHLPQNVSIAPRPAQQMESCASPFFAQMYEADLPFAIHPGSSCGGHVGTGKASEGRLRVAIQAMLVGSSPSVSMNSLTAFQADSKGMKKASE